MKYYEIATVTESNPRPWANMLRNMNKCENGWSNFSASFRVIALNLTELIRFALPNRLFSSISYAPLHREWRHHELSFFALSLRLHHLSIYFAYRQVILYTLRPPPILILIYMPTHIIFTKSDDYYYWSNMIWWRHTLAVTSSAPDFSLLSDSCAGRALNTQNTGQFSKDIGSQFRNHSPELIDIFGHCFQHNNNYEF